LILLLSICISDIVIAESAGLLVYRVWEPGVEPYISRILVNKEFLRIDEGSDSDSGYTLFDRKKKTIINVSNEEETIFEISSDGKAPQVPDKLKLSHLLEEDKKAPKVAGQTPFRLTLLVNGEECRELTVVPGLMDEALEGLRELRVAVASIQKSDLNTNSPQSSACDLANHIYAPGRALEYGLPVLDSSKNKRQALVDFDPDYQADKSVFELPEAYRTVLVPQL
jgi:hypothetical protein